MIFGIYSVSPLQRGARSDATRALQTTGYAIARLTNHLSRLRSPLGERGRLPLLPGVWLGPLRLTPRGSGSRNPWSRNTPIGHWAISSHFSLEQRETRRCEFSTSALEAPGS